MCQVQNYLANDLSDDLDIKRQCRQLYAQGNSLVRKFHMCSVEVKLFLFQSYCSPMYTAHLWWSYSKVSIRKLQIAYHTVFKILLGFSKYDSNSLLCTVFQIRSCSAAIRNLSINSCVDLPHHQMTLSKILLWLVLLLHPGLEITGFNCYMLVLARRI